MPSHFSSTSSVCSPRSGAGATETVEPLKRTGQVGILNVPQAGCSIICMMPRSSKLLSFCSSIVSNTAPAGTPAAPRTRIASRLSRVLVQAVIMASTSGSRSLRASMLSKFGSPMRSAPDRLQQGAPMAGVGAAGIDVDVVVRPAGLARIDPARHVDAREDLGAVALGRHAGRRLRGKRHADVLQHGVLHGDLDALALPGALAAIERAEDAHREQHAGTGVAQRRARLGRRAIALASDAHDPAGRLRDHVEGEVLLVRTVGAEAFDLRVDDARIELLHLVIGKPEPLDGAGREILDADVRLPQQILDEGKPALGFQIGRDRFLVGVEQQEIPGILPGRPAEGFAAGIAEIRVLDLDHFGTEPGQRLGACRPGLELREIEDPDPGKIIYAIDGHDLGPAPQRITLRVGATEVRRPARNARAPPPSPRIGHFHGLSQSLSLQPGYAGTPGMAA